MKLNQVLVVYKKHIGGTGPGAGNRQGKLAPWQRRHDAARDEVEKTLSSMGIGCRLIDRNRLRRETKADLIITLGGDGTVLAAAHAAGDVPILGINTMPGRSVGFFCASTAQGAREKLEEIASGSCAALSLPLVEASIDGKPVPVLALNDVLYAGVSAAEMMRYRISIDGKSEIQRSSGLWISAGPGSTAAMLAAGGRRQSIDSPRLQYLVREPHLMPGQRYRLTGGILGKGKRVTLVPEMGDAAIYIDGPGNVFPVPPNSKLTCRLARRRLKMFI